MQPRVDRAEQPNARRCDRHRIPLESQLLDDGVGGKLKADGIRMSRIERRYERALAALKAIARAMANAAFRVEDYPGSKPKSGPASSSSACIDDGDSRRKQLGKTR